MNLLHRKSHCSAVLILMIIVLVSSRGLAMTATGKLESGLGSSLAEPWHLQGSNELELNLDHYTFDGGFHVGMNIHQHWEQNKTSEWNWHLDEAYIDYYGANFDFRVGKQRLAWGTALQFNPIDVINPVNPSNPMGDKKAVWIGAFDYYLDHNYQLSLVVAPFFASPITDAMLPIEDVEFTLKNVQAAVKANMQGIGGFDAAVMYYYGKEQQPQVSEAGQLVFPRTHVFGGEVATTVNNLGVWVEGAYHRPELGGDYFQWIGGIDYGFSNGIKIIGQYHQRWQDDQLSNQVIVALEKGFGMHSGKIGAIYRLDSGSWMVMPEVEWSLADALNLTTRVRLVDDDQGSLPLGELAVSQVEVSLGFQF